MTDSLDHADLLAGLNPEQIEVVTHVHGPLVVGAVAGAGKTASLVRRIAYLVREHDADPERILALTFSAKAAKEMTTRLRPLLPNTRARVGTFHSLGWQIAKYESDEFAAMELDERDRYRQCIREALGYRGMDWRGADLTVVSQFIGIAKARCALPGSAKAELVANEYYEQKRMPNRTPSLLCEAYVRAEDHRRLRKLVTYDDMLLEAWHRLNSDPSCLGRWASRWDYVLQDESQDENEVQREIATMLAREHRNYMVVGDPAQSIYAFRGSDPSGIIGFEGAWSARKILMHRNYRSADAVIAAANGVLAKMDPTTHLGAVITPCRGTQGVVGAIQYVDMDAEAHGVVEAIRNDHVEGRAWGENVVLFRTNAQSRAIEDVLLTERIPYVVVGGVNFYERKEIKDLLAYLRLAAGRGDTNDVRRCINAPFRYLGAAFVEGLMRSVEFVPSGTHDWVERVKAYVKEAPRLQSRQIASALHWCSVVETCSIHIRTNTVEASRPSVMLQEILDETKYAEWIARDEGTESPENSRVSNLRELVRAAERFATVDELLDYVAEQILAAKQAKADGEDDRVTLMSIHRSKGLEWPVVHVIGVNQGILPHGRCDDEGEERRLAYVAFTRARDVLRVSCVRMAATSRGTSKMQPSPYIGEAGLELRTEDRETVSGAA